MGKGRLIKTDWETNWETWLWRHVKSRAVFHIFVCNRIICEQILKLCSNIFTIKKCKPIVLHKCLERAMFCCGVFQMHIVLLNLLLTMYMSVLFSIKVRKWTFELILDNLHIQSYSATEIYSYMEWGFSYTKQELIKSVGNFSIEFHTKIALTPSYSCFHIFNVDPYISLWFLNFRISLISKRISELLWCILWETKSAYLLTFYCKTVSRYDIFKSIYFAKSFTFFLNSN